MSCSIDQLGQINAAIVAREAIALATFLRNGETRVLTPGQSCDLEGIFPAECEARFRSGKSAMIKLEDGDEVFLNVYVPAPRLIIIGAVHITQALSTMAEIAGLDVIIIDPRKAFATPERFAQQCLHARWPDEVLPEIKLDAYTAVAALSHDPKIDDYPLIEALNAKCFYVGALGSRKTHARRLERLRQAGVSKASMSRIHAPIGLNIGAVGPQEIAVAILAEVINALRGFKLSSKG